MFYASDWSSIYSFERQKNQPSNEHLALYGMSLGLALLLFWTHIATLFKGPIHLGISLSTIAELIAFQLIIFIVTRTEI